MPNLCVEVVYHDDHLMELLTTATNDRFSGVSIIYMSGNGKELIDLGSRLNGFPKSIEQIEEVEFGFNPKDEHLQNVESAYINLSIYPKNG